MTGTAFGFGSPITYPNPQPVPFGLSPQWPLALSGNPSTQPQQHGHPLQQIFQVLQMVPHQLQQLQYAQQQQLQHVQQLLQVVPAQLAQLHQLIQIVPQQIQQLQQQQPQQPYTPSSGLSSFAATPPWGIPSQGFGQPGQVM